MVITNAAPPVPTSDAAAWSSIALLGLGVGAAQWQSPMPIDASSLQTLVVASVALGGAAWFYRNVRIRENFAVMCIALMQVLLFSALGLILSYLLARNSGALWDATFTRWDEALGFDWLIYVRWVDRSAALTGLLHLSYGSLVPQIVVLVLALGFTSRNAELRSVMLAAILCGTICILLSPFFPATSYPIGLGLTGRDFQHVDPWGGYVNMLDFQSLRDGSFAKLNLSKAQGIIAFPSYHAGLSLVTMWGFWTCRTNWLRWSGSTLAALTIVATPVDGGHYFVDVLAGVGIAVISIAASVRAVRWTPAWPRLTASPFRRSHAASGQ